MIGYALDAAHRGFLAVARPFRERKAADPMDPVRSLARDLIARAERRRDTRAINHLQEAMKVFATEALKPVPRPLDAASAGSLTTQPHNH